MANTGYRIPEGINMFQVYNDTNRVIGISGDVTLPKFAYKTASINPAGMAGEYEAPMIGQIASQSMEIPFKQIDEQEFFDMVASEKDVVLRASVQTRKLESNEVVMVPMTVVVRGITKEYDLGTVKKNDSMDASITKEITYIKITINNVVCLEYDKFNNIYILQGKDQFEKLRSML